MSIAIGETSNNYSELAKGDVFTIGSSKQKHTVAYKHWQQSRGLGHGSTPDTLLLVLSNGCVINVDSWRELKSFTVVDKVKITARTPNIYVKAN
ncbi:hypothetical protein [Vibrio agarivorans]|uniref:Uncharacterized protein n=1 Tax=Vibrio agarivorans TaxID=153622 RepID=A0ABT7Y7H0_9VIBR|nr:hypothetical protein [Vibrio agarivorans]MDN2483997.1 hypothetical protein [Vibrio agarivorans]